MTGLRPEHLPRPPVWDCSACGKDWPCDPAREALAEEYAGTKVSLPVLMHMHLARAVADLVDTPVDELFDRFIRWTEPAPLDRI